MTNSQVPRGRDAGVARLTAGLVVAVLVDCAAALPNGFVLNKLTSSLNVPMNMHFGPFDATGRALIVEKNVGVLIVKPSDAGFPKETYLNLQGRGLHTDDETGCVSVTTDPEWHNGEKWIYVYWGRHGGNGVAGGMRISRFRHKENNGGTSSRADLNSEQVIWLDTDGFGRTPMWHYGGQLDWGPETPNPALYLGLGDKYTSTNAQSHSKYAGCIIRINKDGSVPSDGQNLPTNIKPAECWAYGLRNPFKGHWDLQTNRYYIASVGGNNGDSWEALFLGGAKNNYGWPFCEGVCTNRDFPQCDCDDHVSPLYTYARNNGASIIGGAVTRNPSWPSEYNGAYFFADFARNTISYGKHHWLTGDFDVTQFHTNIKAIISMQLDSSGNIWITAYEDYSRGIVYKLSYAAANQPPTIHYANADKTSGNLPLTVRFTHSTTDGDDANNDLDVMWVFGDGSSQTVSAGQTIDHTYTQAGEFAAVLYVSDSDTSVNSNPINIQVGSKPVVAITQPTGGTFRGGDTINLVGVATNAIASGTEQLTGSNVQWKFNFIHDQHTHPLGSNPFGTQTSFVVPSRGHTFSGYTGLKFTFTATNDDGVSTTTEVDMWPEKVTLTIETLPPGISVFVDDDLHESPAALDTMVGFIHNIRAEPTACVGNEHHVLQGWPQQPSGYASELEVPAGDSTHQIVYVPTGSPCRVDITDGSSLRMALHKGAFVDGSASVSAWHDTSGNTISLDGTSGSVQKVAQGSSFNQAEGPGWFGEHSYYGQFIRMNAPGDTIHTSRSAISLPSLHQPWTLCMVLQKAAGVNGPILRWSESLSTSWNLVVSPSFPIGWGVYIVIHDGANNLKIYANGELVDTQSLVKTNHPSQDAMPYFRLGADASNSGSGAVDFAAVLVYSEAMGSTDRAMIEDYLIGEYFSPPASVSQGRFQDRLESTCYFGDQGQQTLSCANPDAVIQSITFSSYGNTQPRACAAQGVGNVGTCHARESHAAVVRSCLGKSSCTPPASRDDYLSISGDFGSCPASEAFEHVGNGCCRDANDQTGGDTMVMHSGTASLARCQELCLETNGCTGVEYSQFPDGNCEVHFMTIAKHNGNPSCTCYVRNPDFVAGQFLTVQAKCLAPAQQPTDSPTQSPTASPAEAPTTDAPTDSPSLSPTQSPVIAPTAPTPAPDPCLSNGWTYKYGNTEVCGRSVVQGNCRVGDATLAEAEQLCAAEGGRLCAASELQDNVARGTGCSLDGRMVWTRSTCPGGVLRAHGGSSLTPPECVDPSNGRTESIRCCNGAPPPPDGGGSAVGTCQEAGWLYKYGNTEVCGRSVLDGECHKGTVTLDQASLLCENEGGRLCTTDELQGDAARGTGCGLDDRMVWTATPCEGGVYRAKGGSSSTPPECVDPSTGRTESARCCAGVDIAPPTNGCDGPGWQFKYGNTETCGRSLAAGECHRGTATYTEAIDLCAAEGGRLCSTTELQANVARGTGCSLDNRMVWTGTACPGGIFRAKGGSSTTQPECVDPTLGRTESVRCCSSVSDANPPPPPPPPPADPCLSNGWAYKYGNTEVCGRSTVNGGCHRGNATLAQAVEFCGAAGGRLCSATELQADVARGTGCSLDNRMVWTSTACQGGVLRAKGGSSTTAPECVDPANNRMESIRCCNSAEAGEMLQDLVFDSDRVSAASTATAVYRINCGGPGFVDEQDHVWSPDSFFNMGTAVSLPTQFGQQALAPAGYSNRLYETVREDVKSASNLAYNLPVPSAGEFQVKLHFIDFDHTTQTPGSRVFDVTLENSTVLDGFDIAAEGGGWQTPWGAFHGSVWQFTTRVSDGTVTVALEFGQGSVGKMIIAGIEVFQL